MLILRGVCFYVFLPASFGHILSLGSRISERHLCFMCFNLFDLEVSKLQTRSKLLCGCLDQPLPVPMASASQGSVGHPHLCRRPCVRFLRGECDDGTDCGFCHVHHAFWSHKRWRGGLDFWCLTSVILCPWFGTPLLAMVGKWQKGQMTTPTTNVLGRFFSVKLGLSPRGMLGSPECETKTGVSIAFPCYST